MEQICQKKFMSFFISGIVVLFLGGCAGPKILIESYSAPRENKKIQGMIADETSSEKGKYLALAIDPHVTSKKRGADRIILERLLVPYVKEKITETNFIYLHPIYDESKITLHMEVLDYAYKASINDIKAHLSINFVINRGISEYYSKTYSARDERYSKSGQGLPAKNEILACMTKKCAKSFIKDISPLKIKQIREFKSLPGDIEYIIQYAKRKNYEGAIEAMERYQGKRNMNFFYNLAVLYEALASEKNDLYILKKANDNYDNAMQEGGSKDDIIISAKARFDNFYRLIKNVISQEAENKAFEKEIDEQIEF